MAVRLMTYVGLLYQSLIKQKQLTPEKCLPPVLPITLYNGKKPWRSPTSLAELMTSSPNSLARYQPQFEFFLLDEGRLTESDVPQGNNLVGALVNIENSQTPQELQSALEQLIFALSHDTPGLRRLRRTFLVWLQRSLLPSRFKGVKLPELQDLSEVKDMLTENVQEWTTDWKRQGIEEGLKEGREQGIKEGIVEGIEQGIQQGIQSNRTDTARKMLQEGLPLEVIHRVTGLSYETIELLSQ